MANGLHMWLYRRKGAKRGLPWEGVRVEQPDGSTLDFNVGERVRISATRLPGNQAFVIDKIRESRGGQPEVMLSYLTITTIVDPFELMKLSPLEQLALAADG